MWLDYLANTTTLLPGTAVEFIYRPQTGTHNAVEATIALIEEGIIAMMGSTYSSATTFTAYVTGASHIPQCCGSSTSPALSSKTEYPFFFRTLSNDNLQAVAMFEYILFNGWKRVSVIYEDSSYGLGLYLAFTSEAAKHVSFNIISTNLVKTDEDNIIGDRLPILRSIAANDVYIIVLFGWLATFVKAGTSLQMRTSQYAWIGSDSMYSADMVSQDGMVVFYGSSGFL